MTSEKYDVPDEPENVKMSVTKQCVRRVNRLTDSSANASNMEFIDSYKRLADGEDVLVYSYIVVLKGFCKNCLFSKTYNLIVDLDKIDTDILRSFHKELIKHYCKEMSEKYPGKEESEVRGQLGIIKHTAETIDNRVQEALELNRADKYREER